MPGLAHHAPHFSNRSPHNPSTCSPSPSPPPATPSASLKLVTARLAKSGGLKRVDATFKLVDAAGAALPRRSTSVTTTWSSPTGAFAATTKTAGYTSDKSGYVVLSSPLTGARTGTAALALGSVGVGGYTYSAASSDVNTSYRW